MSHLSFIALLLLGAVAGARGQQETPRRGQPIQFSEPRNDLISSNLNSLSTGRKDSLLRIEDDLRKPFDFFSSDGSLDGVRINIRPQLPPPVVNSRKARELLDKKKNWVYMDDEELEGRGPTPEEMMGVDELDPETALKKRQTAMERYYHARLERAREQATNAAGFSNPLLDEEEQSPLETPSWFSASRKETEPKEEEGQALSRLFEPDQEKAAFAEFARPKSVPEIFGSKVADAPLRSEVRETRMTEFKQILGTSPMVSPSPVFGSDPFKAFTPGATAPVLRPPAASTFGTPNQLERPSSFSSSLIGDPLRVPSSPGVAGRPSFSSLAPAAPAPTAVSRPTLPPPKFEVPKRPF